MTGSESLISARSIEALVEKVRVRLDYPEFNELQGYRDAVEALDRLASLSHEARRAARGEEADPVGDPNVCASCGHSRNLHFKSDAYVPGKCDYGYDLCGCRDFKPGGVPT